MTLKGPSCYDIHHVISISLDNEEYSRPKVFPWDRPFLVYYKRGIIPDLGPITVLNVSIQGAIVKIFFFVAGPKSDFIELQSHEIRAHHVHSVCTTQYLRHP